MTKLEYAKIRNEERRKGRERYETALKEDAAPPDLVYFWDYMTQKNMGERWRLAMLYNLGYAAGRQSALEVQTNE